MSTPKVRKSSTRQCKKSINSTAVHLTRDLFPDESSTGATGSDSEFDYEREKNKKKKKILKIAPPKRTFLKKLEEKFEKQKEKKKDLKKNDKPEVKRKKSLLKKEVKKCKINSKKPKNQDEENSSNSPVAGSSGTQNHQSWYCYLCDIDSQADMRACALCGVYVHEECTG